MRTLVLIVIALGVGFHAGQTQYRLDFGRTTSLAGYYFAGDFRDDPNLCDDPIFSQVGCVRASRAEVWWQMAQNLALVQAPTIWLFITGKRAPSGASENLHG